MDKFKQTAVSILVAHKVATVNEAVRAMDYQITEPSLTLNSSTKTVKQSELHSSMWRA